MPSRPLTATPALRRVNFGHFSEADTGNQALRKQILERDGNKCVDCGVVFARHMEVRHLDDDHANHDPANLVCVCPFCHLRDHLHTTGYANAGTLIANNSLTQGLVNSIALASWYVQARITDDRDIRRIPAEGEQLTELQQLRKAADQQLNDLTTVGSRWAQTFTPYACDPDVFGEMICDITTVKVTTAYGELLDAIKGLHILPLREAFQVQCEDWFAEFDKTRPVLSWAKGTDSFFARRNTTLHDFKVAMHKAERGAVRVAPAPLGMPIGMPPASSQPSAGFPPAAMSIPQPEDTDGTDDDESDADSGADSDGKDDTIRVGGNYD